MTPNARPDSLEVYTVVLLVQESRCLLLQRSATRQRFPGRWTGIGGRVEPEELGSLTAAALRELREEAGIVDEPVRALVLRRVLLQARPGGPLTVLLYYTGEWTGTHDPSASLPSTPEGVLRWVDASELERLDLIDNARLVLPLLVDDARRDPDGREPVMLGVARSSPEGRIVTITWV